MSDAAGTADADVLLTHVLEGALCWREKLGTMGWR